MVAYLKTQSVLELLNNFSNLSTVAYKGVAYKKNRVFGQEENNISFQRYSLLNNITQYSSSLH